MRPSVNMVTSITNHNPNNMKSILKKASILVLTAVLGICALSIVSIIATTPNGKLFSKDGDYSVYIRNSIFNDDIIVTIVKKSIIGYQEIKTAIVRTEDWTLDENRIPTLSKTTPEEMCKQIRYIASAEISKQKNILISKIINCND